MIQGWKLYNKALLPNSAPHELPNIEGLKKSNELRKVLFARYTTDFDCGHETAWWYLIKDDKVDLSKLNAKKRYVINRGLKNCDVIKISPFEYAEDLYIVYYEAFKNYTKVGEATKKEVFIESCKKHFSDKTVEYYGAFDKESGKLVAYSLNNIYEKYVNLTTIKVIPEYLSKDVSAALCYVMLCDYLNNGNKMYVNDGERSIRHDTNFQDYLIKYFGFRRAYCKLNVIYNPVVKIVVNILYPFRNVISKVNSSNIINNINSILTMEGIRRGFNKNK